MRALWLAVASLTLFVLLGCGAPPRHNLGGKVILGDTAVAEGVVTLHGPDGQTAASSIRPDGAYSIDDPPLGMCQITVQGAPGIVSSGGEVHGENPEIRVRPSRIPKKYERLDNGLQVQVRGGRQTHDIVLKP